MEMLGLSLGDGGVSIAGALLLAALMFATGILGGVIGGLLIGAKDLGSGLASMMGAFYGPLAAGPAAIVVFVVTAFIV